MLTIGCGGGGGGGGRERERESSSRERSSRVMFHSEGKDKCQLCLCVISSLPH